MKSPARIIFLNLFLFVVAIAIFGASFYYLNSKIDKLSISPGEPVIESSEVVTDIVEENSDTCGPDCLAEIERIVADKLSSISESTQTVVEKTTTVVQESSGTTYIPIGTTGSTTSTSWVEVEGTAVYIDLENDYGKNTTVTWEASLKVAHGNGTAFARLYDDTNKIAVDFSELSTVDNPVFEQVASPNLPLWKGRNLYKVQVKSLNSFEVTYSGGRIKISY